MKKNILLIALVIALLITSYIGFAPVKQVAQEFGENVYTVATKLTPKAAWATTTPDYICDGTADDVEIQEAIDACAADNGGVVQLTGGVFTITAALNVPRNVGLRGMGADKNVTFFIVPPNPLPRLTKGTVLYVTASETDAIEIDGEAQSIYLSDFSIDFSSGLSSTGCGINITALSGGLGLTQFNIKNILVNNVDASHYSLYMETTCLGRIEDFYSYGGGFIKYVLTDTTGVYGSQFNCGNIQFDNCFAYVTTSTMTIPPVYMNWSTATSGIINLMQFNRFQVNATLPASTDAMQLTHVWYTDFVMLDLEIIGSTKIVALNSCQDVHFFGPLIGGGGEKFEAVSSLVKAYGGRWGLVLYDDNQHSAYNDIYLNSLHAGSSAVPLGKSLINSKPVRNSGTSLGTGAEQTIAHGLGFTPSIDQISVSSDNLTASAVQTTAPDATNIYVTCNASGSAWHWSTVK